MCIAGIIHKRKEAEIYISLISSDAASYALER